MPFRTLQPVAKGPILAALQEVLGEMRLTLGQLGVVGAALGKKFVLQFTGSQNPLQRQRVGRVWRETDVFDATSKKQRVFLEGDKNMRQIKREVVMKRITAII